MELTPQQQDRIRESKEDGKRRTIIEFTDEQKQEWEEAIVAERLGADENIAQVRKIRDAANQPGFFGDLRRAIALRRKPMQELASAIGVDVRVLSDFRAGVADLPPAALDQLVQVLGLRLTQDLPQ